MSYDMWLEPRDQHECPWCEGDEIDYDACAERAAQAMEDAALDRADSIRKGEW